MVRKKYGIGVDGQWITGGGSYIIGGLASLTWFPDFPIFRMRPDTLFIGAKRGDLILDW